MREKNIKKFYINDKQDAGVVKSLVKSCLTNGKQDAGVVKSLVKSIFTVTFAAVILTLGGIAPVPMVFAEPAVFVDVPENHWAKTNIDFAAENGIVNGYYDEYSNITYFRPENNVSYEEAVTMLYRALVKAGILEDISAKNPEELAEVIAEYEEVLQQSSIATWARPYVAGLLRAEIIEEGQLAQFVDPATGLGNPAPRETVAVWTAKAMDKNMAAVYYLPYTDSTEISTEARPYIDMLYRHGIMKGSLQLDETVAFLPHDGVKRSEFAAISNRVFENIGQKFSQDKEITSYTRVDSLYMPMDFILITERPVTAKKVIGNMGEIGAFMAQGDGGEKSFVLTSLAVNVDEGKLPQLHIDFGAARGEGEITSVETVIGEGEEITIVGIKIDSEEVFYVVDKNTDNEAKLSKREKISFIADGVNLLEIRKR